MRKYPIRRELRPYSNFTPPIFGPRMAGWMGSLMRPPRWFRSDGEITVTKTRIPVCGGDIGAFVVAPKNVETDNCLVYCHGGGFFFAAAGYHYRLAKEYAVKTPCKVIFADYRRTPKHPFPIPAEDCFGALLWALEHTQGLGISAEKIAVGGDSAGGCLAAAAAMMARDRIGFRPRFQLLVYPFTDRRMDSASNRRFTDTPMWNSRLSRIMLRGYLREPDTADIAYASPMEGTDHSGLPDAYIETAEFDCLHDDGIGYAEKLRSAGTAVEVNETEGTMHGFDIVWNAPITRAAVARRIDFMKRHFAAP